MKIVGEIAVWNFQLHMCPSCVKKNIKLPYFFLILSDRQNKTKKQTNKQQPALHHNYDTLHKVWSRVLKILKLEILQSALNDPKLNSKNPVPKVTTTYAP